MCLNQFKFINYSSFLKIDVDQSLTFVSLSFVTFKNQMLLKRSKGNFIRWLSLTNQSQLWEIAPIYNDVNFEVK